MYNYSKNFEGKVPSLTFHRFKGMESCVTCYENPSLEILPLVNEIYGVNLLVTSIKNNYQIYNSMIKSKELNIKYMNFLINDSNNILDKKVNIDLVISQIKELFHLLQTQKITLLLNQSAGVFSGTLILYCLLRMSGENREDALKLTTLIRLEKKIRLGEFRFEFIEKNLIPKLIEPEIISLKGNMNIN